MYTHTREYTHARTNEHRIPQLPFLATHLATSTRGSEGVPPMCSGSPAPSASVARPRAARASPGMHTVASSSCGGRRLAVPQLTKCRPCFQGLMPAWGKREGGAGGGRSGSAVRHIAQVRSRTAAQTVMLAGMQYSARVTGGHQGSKPPQCMADQASQHTFPTCHTPPRATPLSSHITSNTTTATSPMRMSSRSATRRPSLLSVACSGDSSARKLPLSLSLLQQSRGRKQGWGVRAVMQKKRSGGGKKRSGRGN